MVHGFTHNAGQCCIATSRLLVERSVAPPFLDRLRQNVQAFVPVQASATSAQWRKVLAFLDNCSTSAIVSKIQQEKK